MSPPTSLLAKFFPVYILPVETLVQAMLGSGFPVASQGKNASFSASTDTLAVVIVVIWGLFLLAPNRHEKGGAAVGLWELICPERKFNSKWYKIYLEMCFIKHTHLQCICLSI